MTAAQLLSEVVVFFGGLAVGAAWMAALIVRRPGLLGLKPDEETRADGS